MSNISEATNDDWIDFWYYEDQMTSNLEKDEETISNPKEKIKLLTNCEKTC